MLGRYRLLVFAGATLLVLAGFIAIYSLQSLGQDRVSFEIAKRVNNLRPFSKVKTESEVAKYEIVENKRYLVN